MRIARISALLFVAVVAAVYVFLHYPGAEASFSIKAPEVRGHKEIPDSNPAQEAKPKDVDAMASGLIFVNKDHPLAPAFEPKDLVVPDVPFSFEGDHPKKQMDRTAARALETLFAEAERSGIELNAVSGYRSYETQRAIFQRNARLKGEKEANRTSAYPGESEHQTGLAMDVSAASVDNALEEAFGATKEGQWLADNVASFGFIIRYPKGKEEVTGYKYEPWHLRYVGKELAEYLTVNGLTLDEFVSGAKK